MTMGAHTCGLLLGLALKSLMCVVMCCGRCCCQRAAIVYKTNGLCLSVLIDGDFFTRWQHQHVSPPELSVC